MLIDYTLFLLDTECHCLNGHTWDDSLGETRKSHSAMCICMLLFVFSNRVGHYINYKEELCAVRLYVTQITFNFSYGLICQFDKWGNKPYDCCSRRRFSFFLRVINSLLYHVFCVHEVGQCDLCAGFVCIFCSSPRRSTCWSRPRRSSGRSWRRSSNSVAVTWGATAGTMAIFQERCVCGSRFAVVQCSLSHAARILTKRNSVWSTLQPILDP